MQLSAGECTAAEVKARKMPCSQRQKRTVDGIKKAGREILPASWEREQ